LQCSVVMPLWTLMAFRPVATLMGQPWLGAWCSPSGPMPPLLLHCRPAALPPLARTLLALLLALLTVPLLALAPALPLAHRLRLCLYFTCCCFPARALPL
jgi:hypothetical protein